MNTCVNCRATVWWAEPESFWTESIGPCTAVKLQDVVVEIFTRNRVGHCHKWKLPVPSQLFYSTFFTIEGWHDVRLQNVEHYEHLLCLRTMFLTASARRLAWIITTWPLDTSCLPLLLLDLLTSLAINVLLALHLDRRTIRGLQTLNQMLLCWSPMHFFLCLSFSTVTMGQTLHCLCVGMCKMFGFHVSYRHKILQC